MGDPKDGYHATLKRAVAALALALVIGPGSTARAAPRPRRRPSQRRRGNRRRRGSMWRRSGAGSSRGQRRRDHRLRTSRRERAMFPLPGARRFTTSSTVRRSGAFCAMSALASPPDFHVSTCRQFRTHWGWPHPHTQRKLYVSTTCMNDPSARSRESCTNVGVMLRPTLRSWWSTSVTVNRTSPFSSFRNFLPKVVFHIT